MKTKKIYFLFLFFISLFSFSQELLPFVENYTKADYNGDNQIWSTVQGNDNAMYFANSYYFLRYDGVKWEKYSLPNKTVIRSLFVDGDKIYSGSYKEFGYWYRKDAKMIYVSISKNHKVYKDDGIQEVWKIFKFKNKICFQTFNEVFFYDGKNISTKKFSFLISYCFTIDNQLIVASVREGIFKLNGSKFEKIKNSQILENNVIHAIEKYKGKTYYFTRKNGVFVEVDGVIKIWDNPINVVFKTTNINSAKFIKDDKLVIGTASKGVFILDFNKNTIVNSKRENVLMNNSVLSICQDREKNIWLGLDNGIAHIEVNTPVSIFYDNSGILGSVYSVVKSKTGYLMASNHGVFKYEGNNFSLVPNTQGQAWNIAKINDKYIIGHEEGTFLYENGSVTKINSKSGGWNFTKSNINNSYLQATYSGVLIYNDSKNLSQSVELKGFYKPIKYVSQNRENEIWAADNIRGLYKIKYNSNYETTNVENITKKNNISNDFGVKILEFRNEILFLINNSWYTYNSLSDLLIKNELFNSNFKNVSNIVSIDENHFLVVKKEVLYQVYSNKNQFIWNLVPEKYYKGKIINDNLRAFKYDNNYILNIDDGFISLPLRQANTPHSNIKIEAFSNKNLVKNDSKIEYNSELKINVISGLYGVKNSNVFFELDNSTQYIDVKEGLINLNNLSSGYHKVTFFDNNGIRFTPIAIFEFNVANPWYFSFWMVLLYLIVIATILYLYYKWNKIRYIEKLKLREEELKHQRKILELELIAENELNSQEYEKHILELELQSKSSEVTGKSLSIAKQSEMIDNIQKILDTEIDINKLKSEIKKAIKINAVNKHEWETFENNLNQIHDEFIKKLTVKFPNLTSKDIKLCIYLKMNLSSKEISPLMNISFRGVELQRYRLRKKLNLTNDENLNKFLVML